MCLASAIYVFGYSFELRAQTLEQIEFFLKLEYFGLSFVPYFWFILAYRFHFNKYPSFKVSIVAFIIPFITLFLTATNEYHNLYYATITTVKHDGQILADLTRGPWYYIFVIYSYLLLVIGIISFFRAWRNSSYITKAPSFWMLFGAVSLGLISLCYIFGLFPEGIDFTAFGFLVVAVAYYVALFRCNLLEIEEIFRGIVFSEINEGIIVVDDENRLVDYNNAGQEMFKWLNSSSIGRNVFDFEEAKKILKSNPDNYEVEIIRGGQEKHVYVKKTDIKESGNRIGYVYIFQDITKQKEMIDQLNYMAYNDALTGINNRRKFMEEAEKELSRSKRYGRYTSALMIDIDYFKGINDRYGHHAGDKVIVDIVQMCKSRLRETDLIGRYGGEEFAVLLLETGAENAVAVAEGIRARVADSEIVVRDSVINVTVSVGVATACHLDEDLTLEKLVDNADKALYSAKNSGRNRVNHFNIIQRK